MSGYSNSSYSSGGWEEDERLCVQCGNAPALSECVGTFKWAAAEGVLNRVNMTRFCSVECYRERKRGLQGD